MTEIEMQELSSRVAEKYMLDGYFTKGVLAGLSIPNKFGNGAQQTWLHQDSGRIFDLLAENFIDSTFWSSQVYVKFENDIYEFVRLSEPYENHNYDRKKAWRIAALRALDAKG